MSKHSPKEQACEKQGVAAAPQVAEAPHSSPAAPSARGGSREQTAPQEQTAPGKPPPVEPLAAEAKPSLEEQVAALQEELRIARDRELRCLAELDNQRKRATRELEERLKYANATLLRDLLPVMDDVERAIQAAENNSEVSAATLLEGFKLVYRQLEEVLKRHHCRRIEALHAPFDPNFHHAIMQQPSSEFPANTVLTVMQNGYQLHGRVLRPCQVIVSKTE